jgi:hypothetical protein
MNNKSCFNVDEYNSQSSEDESAYLFNSQCLLKIQNIIKHINNLKVNVLSIEQNFERKNISDNKALLEINKIVNQAVMNLNEIIRK